MNMDRKGVCWNCGAAIEGGRFGRRDDCPGCGRDSRVCLNCEFHDIGRHNECREPQAERVVDKERANFCDFFRPGTGSGGGKGDSRTETLKAANDLFK